MTRVFNTIILSAIGFFVLVIILMMAGKITYGGCLADLIPFYFQIAWSIFLLVMFIIFSKRKKISRILLVMFSVIILFSVIFSIRGFTVGRGSCYPWNGHVFVIHNE